MSDPFPNPDFDLVIPLDLEESLVLVCLSELFS